MHKRVGIQKENRRVVQGAGDGNPIGLGSGSAHLEIATDVRILADQKIAQNLRIVGGKLQERIEDSIIRAVADVPALVEVKILDSRREGAHAEACSAGTQKYIQGIPAGNQSSCRVHSRRALTISEIKIVIVEIIVLLKKPGDFLADPSSHNPGFGGRIELVYQCIRIGSGA